MKRWSLEPQKRLNCSWLHLCLKESVLLSRSKRQLKCPRTASGSLSKERFSASGSPHQKYKHIQQLYHHKCPSCFRVRHLFTLRPEKVSWREVGSVPHQRSWGQGKIVFLCFCLGGGLMLKSTELYQFWFEHGAPTGCNKVAGCAWVEEAGAGRPGQSQRPTLLVLGPLDALQVNAILHHLPERAHFSKTLHVVNALLRCVVHLLLCSETTNAKPDRRVS